MTKYGGDHHCERLVQSEQWLESTEYAISKISSVPENKAYCDKLMRVGKREAEELFGGSCEAIIDAYTRAFVAANVSTLLAGWKGVFGEEPDTRVRCEFMHFFITSLWRSMGQVVYIDRELGKLLVTQEFPQNVPISFLRSLPFNCFYLDCDVFPSILLADGTCDAETRGMFVICSEDTVMVLSMAEFEGGPTFCGEFTLALSDVLSIGESCDNVNRRIEGGEKAAFADEAIGDFEKRVRLLLNALCYLCSNEPDIERVDEKHFRSKSKQRRNRRANPVYHVGYRIGSELLKSRESAARNNGEGGKVTPHIRRAHWHRYHCGSVDHGTSHIELRWVCQTFVGMGSDYRAIRPVFGEKTKKLGVQP